ncbi:MAG: hypothetical protein ACT4NV_04995 [Rhodoferax sp.]
MRGSSCRRTTTATSKAGALWAQRWALWGRRGAQRQAGGRAQRAFVI